MKITYTGRQVELAPAQLKKLQQRFLKIGKLLDGRRESEAHVILSLERHLHHAEITVNYYSHQLAGMGSNVDLFQAIHSAADKLEKQCVKAVTKWRDAKRTPRKAGPEVEPVSPAPPHAEPEAVEDGTRVYRVTNHRKGKPMTLDEALLEMDGREMDGRRDYLVYRDAETDRVAVLVRRRDGHFDLVES